MGGQKTVPASMPSAAACPPQLAAAAHHVCGRCCCTVVTQHMSGTLTSGSGPTWHGLAWQWRQAAPAPAVAWRRQRGWGVPSCRLCCNIRITRKQRCSRQQALKMPLDASREARQESSAYLHLRYLLLLNNSRICLYWSVPHLCTCYCQCAASQLFAKLLDTLSGLIRLRSLVEKELFKSR